MYLWFQCNIAFRSSEMATRLVINARWCLRRGIEKHASFLIRFRRSPRRTHTHTYTRPLSRIAEQWWYIQTCSSAQRLSLTGQSAWNRDFRGTLNGVVSFAGQIGQNPPQSRPLKESQGQPLVYRKGRRRFGGTVTQWSRDLFIRHAANGQILMIHQWITFFFLSRYRIPSMLIVSAEGAHHRF